MEDKQVSVEEVKQVLAADFDQLAQAVAQALNAAHAGRIIADTEEPVHDATAVFREQAYEKALGLLQKRQEAFSPSARRASKQGPATDDPSDGQRPRVGA
jgi:hypothetical protein